MPIVQLIIQNQSFFRHLQIVLIKGGQPCALQVSPLSISHWRGRLLPQCGPRILLHVNLQSRSFLSSQFYLEIMPILVHYLSMRSLLFLSPTFDGNFCMTKRYGPVSFKSLGASAQWSFARISFGPNQTLTSPDDVEEKCGEEEFTCATRRL